MKLKNFENMLKDESLYFSKATNFLDPYEGTLPESNNSMRKTVYSADQFTSVDQYNSFISNMPKIMKDVSKSEKEVYIVNCWHINEFESASMWKIYSDLNGGIAIQSTYEKLRKSFRNSSEIIGVGKIRYLDFKKDWGDEAFTLDMFLIKRKSFECDNELRAISYLKDEELHLNGKHIKVDLDFLIEKIYIPPLAESNFDESIKNMIKDNKPSLMNRIKKSDLYSLV